MLRTIRFNTPQYYDYIDSEYNKYISLPTNSDREIIQNIYTVKARNGSRRNILRGRIIGKQGKILRKISRVSNTYLIYIDKKFILFGCTSSIESAQNMMDMIVEGRDYGGVFRNSRNL